MTENLRDFKLQANRINARRLLWVRWILVAAETALILGVWSMFEADLPLWGLVAQLAALVALNLFTLWRLAGDGAISQVELFAQILADVLALTVFLALTGGATNPFVSFYLVPLSLAAVSLPSVYTWILVFTSIGCYSLLMVFYRALPLEGGGFDLHVVGMWLGFMLSAVLVAGFVVAMGKTLRRQQQQLAQAREQQVRDEQILSLGTLAASTAHELGTPLATMQLLIDELDEVPADDRPALAETTAALRQQLQRCREALKVLSASAGGVSLGGGRALAVAEYLAGVREQWQQRRPSQHLEVDWQGPEAEPLILTDLTFSQALNNILDNAADVSPDWVQWHARWDQQRLQMEIRDRGPGLSAGARDRIGRMPVHSSKPQGLGLGVFLAHSVIARFGGRVELLDGESGGLITRIDLPLRALTTGVAR